MKKYAIIAAGGSGTRMGGELPKQFIMLKNRPLLYYTIKTFLETYPDLTVILVLPADHLEKGRELIDNYFGNERIQMTAGGETRFQSVKNGLKLVEDESIVFVHDGVRCLVTSQLIHRCYEAAIETGTAIPAISPLDSIRILREHGSEVLDRNKLMLIQTPQTFHSKIILAAFQIEEKDKFTDEATVVEAYGISVSLVEGEENNIKITKPIDLLVAEKILESKM